MCGVLFFLTDGGTEETGQVRTVRPAAFVTVADGGRNLIIATYSVQPSHVCINKGVEEQEKRR